MHTDWQETMVLFQVFCVIKQKVEAEVRSRDNLSTKGKSTEVMCSLFVKFHRTSIQF